MKHMLFSGRQIWKQIGTKIAPKFQGRGYDATHEQLENATCVACQIWGRITLWTIKRVGPKTQGPKA